jgi:lysophospholipid acyltransferase (LPLAT)-like uncharacterized protein
MAKTSQWLQKYSGQLAATALPLYAKTIDYRASAFDPSCDPARLECQERCVFVFWHEFIGALLANWGWCDLNLLVSQHRDAEWLNQTAARMGYKMTRGSSTRGGTSAIRRLTSLGHSSSLVFTPDGPKGPRRTMAPGALYVASELNLPIVPIGVGFSCCKRLKTWDQFAVPLPLSRVRVLFGGKIRVGQLAERSALNQEIERLTTVLNDLSDVAQSWADNRLKLDGYRPMSYRYRKARLKAMNRLPKPSVSTEMPAAAKSQAA